MLCANRKARWQSPHLARSNHYALEDHVGFKLCSPNSTTRAYRSEASTTSLAANRTSRATQGLSMDEGTHRRMAMPNGTTGKMGRRLTLSIELFECIGHESMLLKILRSIECTYSSQRYEACICAMSCGLLLWLRSCEGTFVDGRSTV